MYPSGLFSAGNWRVGKLFAIPIALHWSLIFFILPMMRSMPFAVALEVTAFIVFSILVHELGHALTAKQFGCQGLSITIHGFGGFASSSGARTLKQDLLITLAGPGATFGLGLVLMGLGSVLGQLTYQGAIVYSMGTWNITLGFLNLVPLLPWDGGRAVTSLLAMRVGEFNALRWVCFWGLPFGLFLLIVAREQYPYMQLFAIVGLISAVVTLIQTGGFTLPKSSGPPRKSAAQVKKEQDDHLDFLAQVEKRQKDREEREKLRRMFEVVDGDDPKK